MCKVSIILTSFNHAPYLPQAIESVINQTFTDWELLIWDDVSLDDSWSIIQSYSDPRIRKFRNLQMCRHIYAINESIMNEAKGEYIAIHHSDDAWMPDKLARQTSYLDTNSEISGVFTHVQLIDEHNRNIDNDWFNIPNQSRAQWLRFFFFQNVNKLCHPSAMVRKKDYLLAGLYKLMYAQIDDAEMWTRLILHSNIHIIQEKLTLHRVFSNGSNVSANNPKMRNRLHFEWYKQKQNYLAMSFFDLLETFPEATQWESSEGNSIHEFLLAMVAIHHSTCPSTQLFGLDLLYKLLIDPELSGKLYKTHRFSYLDFIALSARHKIFDSQEKSTALPKMSFIKRLKHKLHKLHKFLL